MQYREMAEEFLLDQDAVDRTHRSSVLLFGGGQNLTKSRKNLLFDEQEPSESTAVEIITDF
jgi:hypothetical protein